MLDDGGTYAENSRIVGGIPLLDLRLSQLPPERLSRHPGGLIQVAADMMRPCSAKLDMAMSDAINYKNNPLHGVSLKEVLVDLVNHYGFSILFAYLQINCFNTNPSIQSSLKFLKKTDWAREKVEAFYLYKFKNLPRASDDQFELPPRDRVVPEDQRPGEPAVLSLEAAEKLNEKRARKSAERSQGAGYRATSGKGHSAPRGTGYSDNRNKSDSRSDDGKSSTNHPASDVTGRDPWAQWRKPE